MAGRLAPFLEIGVGFNPELTGRDNVVLNGVMMGLTSGGAAQRRAVMEFAGLPTRSTCTVKHYSSGMVARLGFAYDPG